MNVNLIARTLLSTAISVAILVSTPALADRWVGLKIGNDFVVKQRGGAELLRIENNSTDDLGLITLGAGGEDDDGPTPLNNNHISTKKYVDDKIAAAAESSAKGYVADHEGWLHPTITIGTQTWMADNMYVTTYSYTDTTVPPESPHEKGDAIPGSDSGDWEDNNNASDAMFSFPSDETYDYLGDTDGNEVDSGSIKRKVYGNLYQWYAATAGAGHDYREHGITQGICPDGWHVPTDLEWQALEIELGIPDGTAYGEAGEDGWRGSREEAGTALKVGGSSGFNTVFAGRRDNYGSLQGIGYAAYLWSATDDDDDKGKAYRRMVYERSTGVNRSGHNKGHGYSVRCLMDWDDPDA